MAHQADPGWEAYYRFTEGRAQSPLLQEALRRVDAGCHSRRAIDLGCGAGHQCALLLQADWDVHAIDKEPAAIARTQALARQVGTGRLTAEVRGFEALDRLPPASLIHAGFSLPFCHPARFGAFWAAVVDALEPGGIFAGHLFGERDAWAAQPDMTFHPEHEARRLLAGLDTLVFNEFEGMGPSLQGPKHWHRFEVVARKPCPAAR